jgi:CheY-like chemotaxis protein
VADVLVIDDDPTTRALLQGLLEQSGHRVRVALGGADGVRACHEAAPDLVVCDLLMPGQGGLETILALKELCPGPKVLAISSSTPGRGGDFLPVALKLGADRALRKPFSAEQLRAAVEATLAG